MTIPNIALWAARKGIGLVATGDWTHPLWMREIKNQLEEQGNGLLKLKSQTPSSNKPLFLLATEVSCIYSQGGRGRRVHILIWVPSLASADKINQEMTKRGCNLMSDGRPIVGLTGINLAELVLSVEPKALIIPSHAWTPWFSVYGAMSGFDSLSEAFGPYEKNIYAVETGLSSSPAMNWRIKELDRRSIVSFSDAHSGPKLGREATVFEISGQSPVISYQYIHDAITSTCLKVDDRKLKAKIAYTIEFYPEEGKYHYTGHRACNIRQAPEETKKKGTICPVCGKPLTIGVMHRVEELASRSEEELQLTNLQINKLTNVKLLGTARFPYRPPFVMLVPLQEIIAEAIGSPIASPKTQALYLRLTEQFGGEFKVLLEASTGEISGAAGERVAMGVDKVRRRDIVIDPGYDGVFGVVKIWKEGEEGIWDSGKEQLNMFS